MQYNIALELPPLAIHHHTFILYEIHMFKYKNIYRTLDKREYLVIIRDSFCQFCTKTYV